MLHFHMFYSDVMRYKCSYVHISYSLVLQVNMFQPVDQRIEMASEQQRDMEQAFEKLFVKTHGKKLLFKPDLSIVLLPIHSQMFL